MDEQRKHAILFAATLLAARKLIEMEPDRPNMAKGYVVDRAIGSGHSGDGTCRSLSKKRRVSV